MPLGAVFTSTLTTAATTLPAADVWDWGTTQSTAASGTFKSVGGAMGILFILIAAWRAKGAIAGMIAGALSAVIFLFFLHNVNSTEVQEKVKDTVKGAGPVVRHPPDGPRPTGPAT